MEDYIILISPCAEYDGQHWDAGDPIIIDGIYALLPELLNIKVVCSIRIPIDSTDEYVKNAKYIIHAGTPSWVNSDYRRFWRSCIKHKKRISFIGIGMAVPYELSFWYGREEFIALKDSGLIDTVICRDKFCYYWLAQSGLSSRDTHVLPCPGFYPLAPEHIDKKTNVVFSIANIEETSCQTHTTFKDYFDKCLYTIKELENRGAVVYITYQRHLPSFDAFEQECREKFAGYTIHWFPNRKEFADFHKDKHVYIGVRNHGALPCAGAGKPSLLMGVDYRQHLADEIPFISRYDISYVGWEPRFILDWYQHIEPSGISTSLIGWRGVTYERWQLALANIRKALK